MSECKERQTDPTWSTHIPQTSSNESHDPLPRILSLDKAPERLIRALQVLVADFFDGFVLFSNCFMFLDTVWLRLRLEGGLFKGVPAGGKDTPFITHR